MAKVQFVVTIVLAKVARAKVTVNVTHAVATATSLMSAHLLRPSGQYRRNATDVMVVVMYVRSAQQQIPTLRERGKKRGDREEKVGAARDSAKQRQGRRRQRIRLGQRQGQIRERSLQIRLGGK